MTFFLTSCAPVRYDAPVHCGGRGHYAFDVRKSPFQSCRTLVRRSEPGLGYIQAPKRHTRRARSLLQMLPENSVCGRRETSTTVKMPRLQVRGYAVHEYALPSANTGARILEPRGNCSLGRSRYSSRRSQYRYRPRARRGAMPRKAQPVEINIFVTLVKSSQK